MPVTFKVAVHDANAVSLHPQNCPTDAADLLAKTWGRKSADLQCKELLQSSIPVPGKDEETPPIAPKANGFVDTIVQAYNGHHHLVIRPDDVWMAILSQFNIYVNAHAEELRSHFVQHQGKKELIVRACGTRYSVDFGALANQMTDQIDKNLNDKELKTWILPNFTTTTHSDTVICAVYMMSTLKAYFSYTMSLTCGIPSVTLEGEKSDWESLLSRLDKLAQFGAEPQAWARLLRPILTRFVQAFDGQPDADFWGRVCHMDNSLSGVSYLCGWLTAFCVWNSKGKWQGPPLGNPAARSGGAPSWVRERKLELDGVHYGVVDFANVTPGFCEVDVMLDDNGEMFKCMMVAGHCAAAVEGEGKDTVRPLAAWFMFIRELKKRSGGGPDYVPSFPSRGAQQPKVTRLRGWE